MANYHGFIGPAYTLRSKNIDCQRCVNLYPVIDEMGAGKNASVGMLVRTAGKRKVVDFADTGPIRGVYKASNGTGYAVSGVNVYKIDSSWGYTQIGTLLSIAGPVSIADNGVQMMIVDGTYGYIYTFSSGVFAQVTDPDMPRSSHVKFCDGYFILNQVGTGRFFITGLYDGFTIDSLDFATTEGSPDNIESIEVLRRQVWLFGSDSTQVYYNSGDADFPFSPLNGVLIEFGVAAKYSVVKLDQTIFWVGISKDGNGVVYMANGYQPQRISTNAIDFAIQSNGNIFAATAFGYQQEGASFYVVNIGGKTWAYDLNSRLWHERAYFKNGIFERDRADWHMFFNDSHVVGDYNLSRLYVLDLDYNSDNGQPIKWLRAAPHISNDLRYIYYSSFEVDLEFGTGLTVGQGSDPLIMVRTSDDGGHSWSNERTTGIGKIGEFSARAVLSRCGRSRDRVFEVSGTDPVKVCLIGAKIECKVGRS